MKKFFIIVGCFVLSSFHSVDAQYEGLLGINLGSVQSGAFVDMVKSAQPWDHGSLDNPLPDNELDSEGWPKTDFRFFLMDNRPVAEWAGTIDDPESYRVDYSGTYKGSFNGQATIQNIGGPWSIENQEYNDSLNLTTFDLVIDEPGPDHGLVIMNFVNTLRSPEDPVSSGITNLKIIRPGYENKSDQFFTDYFIDALTSVSFSVIRSQNFTGTTSWDIVYPEEYDWDDRKMPDDPFQSTEFNGKKENVAWEYFIDLCNEAGMDIWVNVPISASDNYITGLAQLLKDRLNPDLNIYVENDNEVWNSAPGFIGTYSYNEAEAATMGLSNEENIARRAVQLSDLFASVFGQQEINQRIRVILASHAPMLKWWVLPMLQYINSTYGPPKDYIYALSRQTYFSSANASGSLTENEIIDECFDDIDYQIVGDPVNEAGRPDWVKLADDWELPGGVTSYEGGPHTPAFGSTDNLANQIRMHRNKRMIRLLRYNIVNNWFDLGGGVAMHFTLFSQYNRYGCWGLTDDLHFPDRNYKMEALRNLETVTDLENPALLAEPLSIYPNPSSGSIHLKIPGESNFSVELYNPQGKIVFRGNINSSEGTLHTGKFAPGLYLIRLVSRNRILVKRVLMK